MAYFRRHRDCIVEDTVQGGWSYRAAHTVSDTERGRNSAATTGAYERALCFRPRYPLLLPSSLGDGYDTHANTRYLVSKRTLPGPFPIRLPPFRSTSAATLSHAACSIVLEPISVKSRRASLARLTPRHMRICARRFCSRRGGDAPPFVGPSSLCAPRRASRSGLWLPTRDLRGSVST